MRRAAADAAIPGRRRFHRHSISLLAALMALCLLPGLLGSCSGAPAAKQPAAEQPTAEQPAAEEPGGYQKVSAEEAKQMMEGLPGYVLVDVRTEDEYAEAHIEGAVLIPVDAIGARAADELPGKDTAVFVYCRSGVRSAQAAETLAGLGYTQVFDMGGINGWPYGTVSSG